MVSGSKKRVIEVAGIITWIEAITIFCMILCHTFPSCWKDLNQHKLLIIQTAWHSMINRGSTTTSPSEKKPQPQVLACTWPLQFSHQISGDHFSCFRLLNFLCLVTNRASGIFRQSPSLASIGTSGMMGAVAGPLATAGFVTPAKRATGTTFASTPSPLCTETPVPLPFSVKGGSPPSLGHLS